jgi:hypothetical protein
MCPLQPDRVFPFRSIYKHAVVALDDHGNTPAFAAKRTFSASPVSPGDGLSSPSTCRRNWVWTRLARRRRGVGLVGVDQRWTTCAGCSRIDLGARRPGDDQRAHVDPMLM